MKKRAIFKIIIFSVIGIVLIGVLIYGLTNKKVRSGLSLGGFFYANASEYKVAKEKVQLSDLTIDEIEVNWIGGNVLIKYSEDATISFKETFDNKDENSNYLMRYLVKDNKLTIQFCKPKWYIKKKIRDCKNLEIYLPKKSYHEIDVSSVSADIDYQGSKDNNCTYVKLESVSGNIVCKQATTENIKVENVSGNIYIADVKSNKEIEIDSVSGALNFEKVETNQLEVDTVSSKINISGKINHIELDSVSSDVDLMMYEAPETIHCDTVSGMVRLILPENEGFSAVLDSVSGNISSNFEVTYTKKQIVYKNARFIYKFNSVSGDVSVNKQNDN